MNPGILIAIYLPIIILLVIIIPYQQTIQRRIVLKRTKRQELRNMTNEMLKKHIGKTCKISGGPYGMSLKGKIIDIKENWIEVETNKGNNIINAEFVQRIEIIS